MKVVWTEQAASDLEAIVDYIAVDNREAASRVARRIFATMSELSRFPLRGRPRTRDAEREIVFAPWPYIAVYEVRGQQIFVKAIRHASRDLY